MAGDLNLDGTLTIAALRALVGVLLGLPPGYAAPADVNADGAVNAADVSALADLLLRR